MSIFDRLNDIANRAVDQVNAEAFRLEPRVFQPNGHGEADSSRETIEGRGVFDMRQKPTDVDSMRRGARLSIEPTGYQPELSVSDVELDGLRLRQGDLVTLPDQPGEPRFRVSSARNDGHGRTVLILSKA